MAGIEVKLLLFLLLFSFTIHSQDTNSPDTNKQNNKEDVIKNELRHLRTETDLKIKNLEDRIERDYRELKGDKEALKERINLYVAFVLGILGLIAFLINFFGKRAIKERVENIIQNTIDNYAKKRIDEELEKRITDDAVKKLVEEKGKDAIDKLINKLDREGKNILEGQNERYNTLFNELKIKKDEFEKETTVEDKIKLKEFGDVLSKVKKEEDYSATDWHFKGKQAYEEDEYDEAIDYFNKSIKLNPDNSLTYHLRGLCYAYLKKFELSLSDFNKSIQLDPQNPVGYNNRGNNYLNMGKFDQALDDLNKSIQLDPNSALAYSNRGITYSKINKINKAINDFNKSIQLNKNNIRPYQSRASLYFKTKEYDKSINDYNKCLEIDKDNLGVSLSLAEVYIAKNDMSSAESILSNMKIEKDNEKYFAIKYFLQYIIAVLKHNDTKVIEDKLNNLLLQNPKITWSFDEIEKWVPDSSLSEPDKNKIQGMIDLLKKYED